LVAALDLKWLRKHLDATHRTALPPLSKAGRSLCMVRPLAGADLSEWMFAEFRVTIFKTDDDIVDLS